MGDSNESKRPFYEWDWKNSASGLFYNWCKRKTEKFIKYLFKNKYSDKNNWAKNVGNALRTGWDWEDCPAGQVFYWLKEHLKIKEKNIIFNILVIFLGALSIPALWFFTYLACE